jgi:uncharacterized protein
MLRLPNHTYSTFQWNDSSLLLLPEKAAYDAELGLLMIADPHFGKAAHFRKAGIPIPEELHVSDQAKILKLVHSLQPKSLIFLGDLFHSDINSSWQDLEAFLDSIPDIEIHLVKGNHDILPASIYRSGRWNIHEESYQAGPYLLTHEPMKEVPEGSFNCCGHIHPGIRLKGNARQQLTLPCFFIKERQMILPAFGRFTGLARMSCSKNNQAYAITAHKVIPVDFSG